MSTIIDVPESPSSQLQVALCWFDLFTQSNFEKLKTVLMDDFMHYILPLSAGMPSGDKEESIFNWKGFREVFNDDVKYSVQDVVECPGKVFLRVTLDAVSKSGQRISDDFSYNFRIKPDENGVLMISEIRVFVDTIRLTTFFPEEAERLAASEEVNE